MPHTEQLPAVFRCPHHLAFSESFAKSEAILGKFSAASCRARQGFAQELDRDEEMIPTDIAPGDRTAPGLATPHANSRKFFRVALRLLLNSTDRAAPARERGSLNSHFQSTPNGQSARRRCMFPG
ncbi:MAG TPA: hypothetical protein VGC36_10970 [Rhizomicrobium sp.]